MVASSWMTRRVAVALVAPVALLLHCIPPAAVTVLADCTAGYAPEQGDYTQCVPVPGEQADSSGQLPGGLDLVNGESQGSWGAAGSSGGAAIAACEANAGEESAFGTADVSCPSA